MNKKPDDTDSPYMTGQLLVAMPQMRDPRFARSVIYMCAHNAEGAMGLVVNRRVGSITFEELLQQLGIRPHRSLADDLQLQTNVMNYGGNGSTISLPPSKEPRGEGRGAGVEKETASSPLTPHPSLLTTQGEEPDFRKMTPAEKIAYHRARWDRILG